MEQQLEKLTLEFQIDTSSRLLYTMISTPEGLARWFAESVTTSEDDLWHFRWADSEQCARLVQTRNNALVKFQWMDELHRDVFLEMEILQEPMSTAVSLQITDFAEASEVEFTRRLWCTQVGQLQRLFKS